MVFLVSILVGSASALVSILACSASAPVSTLVDPMVWNPFSPTLSPFLPLLFYLFFLDSKKGEDNMRKFIVGRLLSIIPVLMIVSVVIFAVVHLTPGDPAASILGDEATVEDIAALRAKMGLDKPVVEQ